MIRVGVIGFGKMGLLHASILSVLPCVQLVAVCERNLPTRISASRLLNRVKVVRSMEELSLLGLDAAYVTTPASSHFAVAAAVYSKHIAKHVFVEKPLACSGDEATRLCSLAEDAGGVNMVGYNRRFIPIFVKAKEIVDDGILGEVGYFEARAHSSDFVGTSRNAGPPAAIGGVLSDLGCHAIDLALWFLGSLEIVSARTQSRSGSDSEDSAHFSVRSPGGFDGEFHISWCMEDYRLPEIALLVQGSKGEISVNEDTLKLNLNKGQSTIWHRPNLDDKASYLLGGTEYFREDEVFARAILGECAGEPDFRAAAVVDRMIDQVRLVASTGEQSRKSPVGR